MRETHAYLYCRIDRGKNTECAANAAKYQKQILLSFAKQNSLQIAGCFEDIGYSGCDPDRPGLRRLFAQYSGKPEEIILTVSLDRLVRSALPQTLQKLMRGQSLAIYCVTQQRRIVFENGFLPVPA